MMEKIRFNKINSDFIIIGLIALNICMLAYVFFIKSSHVNQPEKSEIVIDNSYEVEELVLKILSEENKEINTKITLHDTLNNVFLLNSFIRQNGRFFFFIPSSGCHSCLGTFLYDIQKYCGEAFLQNIVFYTSFQNRKNIIELQNDFKINVFSIEDNYFGFLSEREQDHFMFFLDKQLKVHYFYQPTERMMRMNIKYYRLCKDVFNK